MSADRFVLVECGAPRVVGALPDVCLLNRLAIIGRTWDDVHGFDGATRYRWVVADPPIYGVVVRMLAHTIYNPSVAVESKWLRCGEYDKSELISLVEQGLLNDDDIIQQWFGADDVVRLLSAARSWHETLQAVAAIGGSHEIDSDVRLYAQRVLGRDV